MTAKFSVSLGFARQKNIVAFIANLLITAEHNIFSRHRIERGNFCYMGQSVIMCQVELSSTQSNISSFQYPNRCP